MYRKDVFAKKGLTMPAHPTWQQVADLAAKADGAEPGMKGICLRGLPGWGEVMAPLTTVVNTFGGTWFDKDWKARLDLPRVREGDEVLCRPGARARRVRRRPVRLRRVPQQHDPGQGRHVVRRHLRGRIPGGRRTPPSRARSATPPPPWRRPSPPAGSTPGPGASRRPPATPTRPGSSSPGRPASSTRSWSATRSAGPTSRPASGRRPTPTRTTARRPPPSRR